MIEVLRLALKALNAGEHAHLIMNTDGIKDKVRQAIAGLESQEPVALETVYETIIQWDEGGGKRSRRELARRIIDLYTHPPQRTEQEPVPTIEELEQEIYQNTRNFVSLDVMEWMLKRYYTHPPQRTWVGLMDEEIRERWFAAEPTPDGRPASYNYAKAIEAKLKEKNNA